MSKLSIKHVSSKQWTFIVLWVVFNLADTLLTLYMWNRGGDEINLVYKSTGSLTATVVAKWLCVALVPLFFFNYRRLDWLIWFLPVGAFPVAFNLWQILLHHYY